MKFSANRRTLILTAPSISMPPELESLVEYVDLPLPDLQRVRQIVEETFKRLSKAHTLQLKLDGSGVDAMAANLRGLTEEEAELAISQTLVARYALCPETITDVLEAKKELLRHSGMLEFIDASDNMASVGGLDNLKRWLTQRRGAWEDAARKFGLEPPRRCRGSELSARRTREFRRGIRRISEWPTRRSNYGRPCIQVIAESGGG